jgi:hypothetical protein
MLAYQYYYHIASQPKIEIVVARNIIVKCCNIL